MRELQPLVKRIKSVVVTVCPVCFKAFVRSSWIKRDLQEVVERQVERNIDFSQGSHIEGMMLEPVEPVPGKQMLQLTIIGSADGQGEAYEEYYEVPLLIQGNRCTECERLANAYFTGILQLRRGNETVSHEIERLLGRAMSGVKDVTGGIDYYVTDHRILQNVAREVHSKFGGELTIRAQHFSYDSLTSKNLYRVNACLRLPKFWKGSLITAGTKLFLITNMGKMLKGMDITSGKVQSVPCNNEYETHTLVPTSVVTVRPTLTVLDPETYQTVPVANSLPEFSELTAGEQVMVSVVEDRLYVVPQP